MKKYLGLVLLAVLLIFGAGCVTSSDEIVGTWQTQETDDGVTETITQTLRNDGTGSVQYIDSDGDVNTYFALWTKVDERSYMVLEYPIYTFSEDQKIMMDNWDNNFKLEEGGEKIGGLWTEVTDESDDDYYTFVFNKDGTGVGTYYETGEKPEVYDIAWYELDGQIVWAYTYTYPYTEDGRLEIGDEVYLTEIDGKWVLSPDAFKYGAVIEIINGYWIEKYYSFETDEFEITYVYYVKENEAESLVLYDAYYIYPQTLQADGTILCDCGDVYTKVTA